jgi:hypothetical protein
MLQMNKKSPTDVTSELNTNLEDLRNNIVKESDYETITSQTGVTDKLEIEKVLLDCQGDISLTILRLLSLQTVSKPIQEPTIFEQIREILNEKDRVYHDLLAKNRAEK